MRNSLLTGFISVITCSMFFLSGCGGGSSTQAPAGTKLSGTAAAGAPLVGIVTVKDPLRVAFRLRAVERPRGGP